MYKFVKLAPVILLIFTVSFSSGCNWLNSSDSDDSGRGNQPHLPPQGEIVSPDYNLKFTTRNLDYTIGNNYDTSGLYLRYDAPLPTVVTHTNDDGTISVAVFNDDKNLDDIYIYEYSSDLEFIEIVSLKKEFPLAGAFTKDFDGNYYVFYANDVEEGAHYEHNMALVKYDRWGMKENIFTLEAFPDDSLWGVKLPFRAGACRMEIAGNLIAVYFARQMFMAYDGLNHQASYGFILNKNTFEKASYDIPYASHSFNQFILPDGDDFVFVDHGDAYPRAFAFEKVEKNGAAYNRSINSFTFKYSYNVHYNFTFAQMGGLVNIADGYLFMGAYEKTDVADENLNDSRNMFILKLNRNLSTISEPIWITDYSDKYTENVANPKIAELAAGRYLLMWECMRNRTYYTTYAKIIDKDGNTLKDIMELPRTRLNMNDVLRYNAVTGSVNWAINDYDSKTIALYSFNPDTRN